MMTTKQFCEEHKVLTFTLGTAIKSMAWAVRGFLITCGGLLAYWAFIG